MAAETTPSKLVYDNPDGSRTARLSIAPQRYKDSSGAWVDYDLDIVTRSDGSLGAKAAPQAASLAKTAVGSVATVGTSAGPVVLRHPAAAPAAAALKAHEATYRGALSAGRDLVIALTPDGFEESVILHSADAPASYIDELVLPAGVTARNATEGVELIDRAGAVIAGFGRGFAYDANLARGSAPTPVSVRLVSQTANIATVEVVIADPEWLAAAERSFPVTIDPTVWQQSTYPGYGGLATIVIDTAPTTAFYGNPSIAAGLYSNGAKYRSLFSFNVSSIPAGATVLDAQLKMVNTNTGFTYDCTNQRPLNVYRLGAPFSTATTWNTQPGVTGTPEATSFAHQPYPNAAGTNCPPAWQGVGMQPIVQEWVNGGANNGVGLRADESQMSHFQHFWSAHIHSGLESPFLEVTWDRLPTAPGNVAALANADGSVTVNWSSSTVPTGGSAIDYYAILAENPDGSYAGETMLVYPNVTTTTFTNLARSKDYKFGVYPHNGAGYNLAVTKAQATTVPDPLVRAGDSPFFTYDSFALNDRLGAQVNIGTGNLEVSAADIAIPVVGGSRTLGRSYNSLALAPASTYKSSPLFGPAWRFSEAPDRRLLLHSDGSVTYLSGSGRAQVFAAGTLAAPAGTDATLVKNANGTYKLTFHHSALVLNFRSDGLMTSEVDRNGNTIAFNYPAGGGYPTSIAGNAGAAPANTVTINYGGPGGKVSSISQTADGTTRTVSYTYDAAGYLYQVTDAGGVTTFEYDPTSRNLIKITGPAPISQVTQFGYDSARRVTSVTRALPTGNSVTSYNYTNPSQPTRTDARSNVTTFTVDGAGRVTKPRSTD